MDMLPVETLRVGTDEITILAGTAETAGDLFAVEVRMPPGGGPPVLHRHAPSEVYRVLSGELTFHTVGTDGHVVRVAGPGETVTLAGGTPHTIRNEGDVEAVAFGVHAPGGAMEGFSRAAADLAAQGDPTIEDVLEVAQQHGIEMLGPVPTDVVPEPQPAH